MMLATARRTTAARRSAFTLLEVLVVVAILVILAGVGIVGTTRYLEDARKGKAKTDCKTISEQIDAYKKNPANPEGAEPSSLMDLVRPPFGGTGFLKNGVSDLTDPWGQQYQMQPMTMGDGSQGYLVYTTSKSDGVMVSQFGIGEFAKPRQ
jgi:general secretion pathway protein G